MPHLGVADVDQIGTQCLVVDQLAVNTFATVVNLGRLQGPRLMHQQKQLTGTSLIFGTRLRSEISQVACVDANGCTSAGPGAC